MLGSLAPTETVACYSVNKAFSTRYRMQMMIAESYLFLIVTIIRIQ